MRREEFNPESLQEQNDDQHSIEWIEKENLRKFASEKLGADRSQFLEMNSILSSNMLKASNMCPDMWAKLIVIQLKMDGLSMQKFSSLQFYFLIQPIDYARVVQHDNLQFSLGIVISTNCID